MEKATLVLEGGGARGLFTSGVVDYFIEKDLYFSNVVGVSAGACNAVNYVAKQKGRMCDCMIHKDHNFSYMNLRNFVRSKSLMDMDLLFDKYPNEVYPFDYDTYFQSETEVLLTVTNCQTGKAEYLSERKERERLMKVCRASSSLPLVSPIVKVDNVPYLDGGLADAIPIKKALELGNDKIVVVLTRNPGYVKKQTSVGVQRILNRAYHQYPETLRVLRQRANRYNKTLEYIHRLEKEERIFVIRPQIPTISKVEQKYQPLQEFYDHGYTHMSNQYDNLLKYLNR